MPGSTSTANWTKSPPFASPRQTRNCRLAMWLLRANFAGLEILDLRVRDRLQLGRRIGTQAFLDDHLAVAALRNDDVVLHPLLALAGVIEPGVSPTALFAGQRRPSDDLGHDQQRAHRQRLVPSRVVLARAGRLQGLGL